MEHAKTIYKIWKHFKLTELYLKLFNEPFEKAHDALEDVYATARCYYIMTKYVDLEIEIEDARKNMH
jgi:DNA polymerase III epsilon subunit-like protein